MEKEELKENIKSGSQWLRLLFMILFVILFEVAAFIAGCVILFQFLHTLILARSNEPLQKFGSSLSQYFAAIVAFQTYNTEEKPFPFADWPEGKAPKSRKKVSHAKKAEDEGTEG